jgi:nitrogen fixation/metabolism regulation signal transduction histidine kinase
MQKRSPFESQLTRLSLVACIPLLLLLIWVMIYAEISIYLIMLVVLFSSLLIIYTHTQIHQRAAYQFRSLSNLLDAMIQGDYSLRARSDDPLNKHHGALDELVKSINGLAQRLSQQRLESVESQLLLATVIDHIDVAIVALNQANQISFFNPAAEKLLQLDNSNLNIQLLPQLEFVQSLSSGSHQVIELRLGHLQGKFNIHIEEYRESGKQHKLLFITDVRNLLRSEESKAWQSLVRVISHEINNSLTPIASLSQTMQRMLIKQGSSETIKTDLVEGLTIIAERANGLSHFVSSYKQLAKLPDPEKKPCLIGELVGKVSSLFDDCIIEIENLNDIKLNIDPVQFEQVLINLIKNASESMRQIESNGIISIRWEAAQQYLKLYICDQGIGISNIDNLFVPFYSTKQHGSGIGLVLCRQVIEAHNGQLVLINRSNSQGCCAIIEIPMSH